MRTYRAFLESIPPPGDAAELCEDESRHLGQVLRASPGLAVELVDGKGTLARGELLKVGKRGAEVRVLGREVAAAPPRALTLGLAVTRTDAFEDAIQRAVELGATRFVPLACDRCVVTLDAKREAGRLERWRRIALAGLKQSERLWLPEIAEVSSPTEFLDGATSRGERVVALVERHGEGGRRSLAGPLAIAVGPEGGWSPAERQLWLDRAEAWSLGGTVLRSETAALAALALAGLCWD